MDRVSSLPNELLCHILSFLPTKNAALTSVLSKRWLNLFALVPNLEIDDSVFLLPEEDKRERPEIIQSFMNFVDRVLALQGDSPIKKFSFKCVTEVDKDRVDGWISNVLARGVSDLDLCIFLSDEDLDDKYWLSPKRFESRNLVKLKIDGLMNIGWLAVCIFLPMLKTLVLSARVNYKFDILLHALPALEELVLDDCIWIEDEVSVSSVSLKTLAVTGTECLSTLSFDTPSLVYFKHVGYLASDYPVVNMKNLIEARIIFSLTEKQLERVREPDGDWLENDWHNEDALAFSNVWKLFHGIQNVQYLDLFPNTLEVLSLCCESMPVFNNLKYLAIQSAEDRGWQAMPVLLRNCPNLETLVLEGLLHYETDKCGDACDSISRDEKGRSLASCPIKMLDIQGFRGTMKEMNMIKHFLDYFPCLEDMEIYVAEEGPTQLTNPEISELILELIELYNKSSSCNVQLLVSDYLYNKWTAE